MLKVIGWFGLVSILFGGMTLYASLHAGPLWSRPAALATLTFPVRMEHLVYAEGYNVWKPWWPFPARLVANSLKTPAWCDGIFWVCLLALAGAIWRCFAVKTSRQSGFWAVGAAYLFLVLPMAGLFDSPYFLGDRSSYLASLPWAIAVAVVLAACTQPALRKTAVFTLAAILCGQFALSRHRLGGWRDSQTFFPTALGELSRPDGEKEHLYYMWANQLEFEGQFDESRAACGQGLKEFPASAELDKQRAAIDQAARDAAQEAGGLGLAFPVPGVVKAHERIARQKMQNLEWEDAADHLRAALQVMPDYYPARFELAQALVMQGETAGALSCYLQATASSRGNISQAKCVSFLFMLAQVSAVNGEERLARIALAKGQALRAKSSRASP
jgi:tetratricopeptide (TPR) repeat protein